MRVPTFRLAAGCAAASMALMVGGLALAYMNRHLVPAGMRWSFSDFFGEVVNLAVPVVGLVLASRRPANPVGWLFLVAGLALGLSAFSEQYGLRALVAAPRSLPAGQAFAWLSLWNWVIPLAVFITAVYAALVVGVGTLAGGRDSPLLAALAAAVVAIAFQPARQRAGRLANRVVYGRRATPYQVLSDFTQRIGVAYSIEDVLPQMAQIVAAGTGAERVVVWLRVDDQLRAEVSSDDSPDAASLPVNGHELPSLPHTDLSVPVMYQGELLGAISVRMPKGAPLRPAGEQLVADVASQAGLVLSNAGLVEDLRASRQRLVAAQDEERRRLERNIHDSAQQDLVALAIKLRLAAEAVDDDPARQILGQLQSDAARALENLRDLAHGIYPPLLADLGLVAALNAQASKSAVPVTVGADRIGRFGQDTEAAVYFCCLEALQNIAKYAHATSARICLQAQNGALWFTVSDDGTGYDARDTPLGSGQRNMADRLAALGGRLEVRSAPRQGTTITGHLPARSRAAAGVGAAASADSQTDQERQ